MTSLGWTRSLYRVVDSGSLMLGELAERTGRRISMRVRRAFGPREVVS